MSEKINRIVDEIAELTLIEANSVAEELKKKFNLPDFAAMMPAAGGGVSAVGEASAPVEEKTSFALRLRSFGDQKTKVIKVVRDIKKGVGEELGLKEVKDLVESAPVRLLESVVKDKFEEYSKMLKDVGAEVDSE